MSERLSTHLSDKSVNEYRQRTMTPAELIAADDHLATCDVCSERIGHSNDPEAMFVTVPTDDPSVPPDEPGHLSYEQLASYLDDELDDVEREICDVHLQVCSNCSGELADLNVFRKAILDSEVSHRDVRVPSRWETLVGLFRPRTPLQFSGVAAIAALLLTTIVWGIWLLSLSRRTEIAESTQVPATEKSPSPSTKGPIPSASAVASPEFALTLNDGGGLVALDKEGNLSGLADLSPSHQQAVRTVLLSGHLNIPLEVTELSRKAGTLMGGKTEGVSFALMTPVGTVARTTRPTFRWQSLDGASSYVVNVYDSSFTKVATSLQLSATQWTIPNALNRGTVYLWQVTANKNGEEIKSPVQPAPEAKFKILEAAKADELDRVRHTHPNRHLLLGTLYAQAGLLDDAEREFRALVRANPKSSVAQTLLRSIMR